MINKVDRADADGVPVIDISSAEVISDPFTEFGLARERAPLALASGPGFGPIWAVTRYFDAKRLLSDPRFKVSPDSFPLPGVPQSYEPYLSLLSTMNDPAHSRLRRLAGSAFSPRRSDELRHRISNTAKSLLDSLPTKAVNGTVDLCEHFAYPLPAAVIADLVGIPRSERQLWQERIMTLAAWGDGAAEAVCGILDSAKAVVHRRRTEPSDDLISDLIQTQQQDGDRLSDTELVAMIWQLVAAGQESPANFLANAIGALLTQPDQLKELQQAPSRLMSHAVEELLRWCSPVLLTSPRYASEDIDIGGTIVRAGEPTSVAIASVNRDPRAFTEPDRLDIYRSADRLGHLSFGHGSHFCLGAALARTEMQIALTQILEHYPNLALAVAPHQLQRATEPGVWRLQRLPVLLR